MGVVQTVGQRVCRNVSTRATFGTAYLSPILMLLTGNPVLADGATAACCADLEMRVSELEAVAVRARGRNVDLTISGAINRALLFWNDGQHQDAAFVTNDNDNSVGTIEGEVDRLGHGWSIGFVLDFDILDAGSADVSQRDQRGIRAMELGELSVWLKSDWLGEVSIGKTSARSVSSGANEKDLSGTEAAAYVGVTDVGGGFFLRRSDAPGAAGTVNLKWEDLIDSLDEPDGDVMTYSSPELFGFSATALWGEDDVWNLAAAYHQAIGPAFQVAAAIAVNENHQGEVENLPDHRTTSGSMSVLHKPSGLSLTLAGGVRTYILAVELTDGRDGLPASPHFYYSKIGWQGSVFQAGTTAAYVEYGRFTDFLGRDADSKSIEELAGLGSGSACQAAGSACFISESEAQVWGAGVVQSIWGTGVQLYLSYRHFGADIGLSDAAGSNASSAPLAGLDLVMTGMLIEF